MDLVIKENNGVVLLEGSINNATTVDKFKRHMGFLLLYKKTLTINISGVTAIGKNGLKVIENLFLAALYYNKKIDIIGYGCKDIYESMETNRTA